MQIMLLKRLGENVFHTSWDHDKDYLFSFCIYLTIQWWAMFVQSFRPDGKKQALLSFG